MDRDERARDKVWTVDKDTRINVVVNNPDGDGDAIDLRRVLHNARLKSRIYVWVLLLCVAAGLSAALLYYQFSNSPTTVTSVVTLNYVLPGAKESEEGKAVTDLTAPDGEGELDLNQITSSYVLQNALSGIELSQPVTLSSLRDNVQIDKILTEDSRRQQEVAASMIQDKNNGAYTQVQGIKLTYDNRFVVSLTNGFGNEESRGKIYLTDSELRLVLDRILAAYNDYLVLTYADVKLPDDEISVIDIENLDILESLDLLRTAVANLYEYCDGKSGAIKAYRSWRTGRSLTDLMNDLEQARDVNVDYLYSYVYTNSIVKDRNTMIINYQYQLRNARTELDKVNEQIATTQTILENYKNDEIFVSMQESDTARSTQTTTDYYNKLVLQQSENYGKAAALEITITDLEDKISSLDAVTEQQATDTASEELQNAVSVCRASYNEINAQMEEIVTSPFYTSYARHTLPQGKSVNFLVGASKLMILGALAGIVIACGLWFLSALAPEFSTRKRRSAAGKEAVEE